MKKQCTNTLFKQHGFSLIEAIVAFLILSIGMLGIASLQLISLKSGRVAELRTVAVIKAEEVLERIRTNPVQVLAYASSAADTGTNNSCNDSGGSVNICTSAEMAEDDIYNWKLDLTNSLPDSTTATIVVVAPTPGTNPAATVTVTINWQERNAETQTMDDMSYSVSSHICDNTSC